MAKKPKPAVYCFGGRGAAELIKRIDEFRWRARMPSRAAAIRLLLEEGLDRDKRQDKRPSKGESSSS